jgi:hypothetical protein
MGSGGIVPPFVTLALDGGEWSPSGPGRFTPGENAPDTHLIRGRVGPRAGLNAVGKTKLSCRWRESKPDSSVVQPIG